MAFDARVSARQTGYNIAGTLVAALLGAGLVETKEEALDDLETIAGKVFEEITAGMDETTVVATTPATRSTGWSASAGPGDTPGETVFNFGAFKGKTIAEVAGLDAGAATVVARTNGKSYSKAGSEYLNWLAESTAPQTSFMRKQTLAFLETAKAGV